MSEIEYNVNNRLCMLNTIREVLELTKEKLDHHEEISPSSKAITSEEAQKVLNSIDARRVLENTLSENESDEDRLEASIIEIFLDLGINRIYFGTDIKNPDKNATIVERETSSKKFRSKGIEQTLQTRKYKIIINKNG